MKTRIMNHRDETRENITVAAKQLVELEGIKNELKALPSSSFRNLLLDEIDKLSSTLCDDTVMAFNGIINHRHLADDVYRRLQLFTGRYLTDLEKVCPRLTSDKPVPVKNPRERLLYSVKLFIDDIMSIGGKAETSFQPIPPKD